MIKLLIIDGLNLIRRIYSALPANSEGSPDEALFLSTCENTFKHVLEQHQPSHAVCVFEHYTSTWRHALYPPYKANRKPQPQTMLNSFSKLKRMLESHGIASLDIEGYEADDIIASIAHALQTRDCDSLILSTDHLMAQLISDRTQMYDHFKQQHINPNTILERYGIEISQLADYFALVGSSSVNVPGIAGIGKKTASKLLAEHQSIDKLLEEASQDTKTNRLLEGKQHALYLYRALFQLRLDCPIQANLKSWRVETDRV